MSLKSFLHLLLFSTSLVLSDVQKVWAWPPTYGAEFEVTRSDLKIFDALKDVASETNVKDAQMLFVKEMQQRCKISKCTVKEVEASWDRDYMVIYPDGWWFKISYDPGCVEFTFKPSTLETLQQKAGLINDQIFKTAKDLGFKVQADGVAHFNMGVRSSFGDDPKKFLRFFVDYSNHTHLAFGSLGRLDVYNAPPLSFLAREQRLALQEIINEVTSGKITTVEGVARAIQDRVYAKSYYEPWGSPEHYQAIGLKYVYEADLKEKDVPMELRSVWAQDSAERFNLIARLVEGRVAYLNALKDPIVYTATERTEYSNSELRSRFAIYVAEAGLNYEEFKSLIPDYIRTADYDDFVRNDVSLERRIADIERYWDLIPASSWVRNRVIETLMNPLARNVSQTEALLKKMRNIVYPKKQNSTAQFFSGIVDYFRLKKPNYSPETIKVFQYVLNHIESQGTKPYKRTDFVRDLNNQRLCPSVFNFNH